MGKTGLQRLPTPMDSVLLLTDHLSLVMNTEGEIRQAIEDYQQGWMGEINS
jgi:redox-sensitive bicupin YhaK (pirin superfamily)